MTTLFFIFQQLKQKHLRRRLAEKALRKFGVTRKQAINLARHIP